MKNMKHHNIELPEEYHILPESIDFIIPGFEKICSNGSKTFALRKRDCAKWYNEFVDRLVAACGRKFLPVCRMSDGEFKFALGNQLPSERLLRYQRFKKRILGITVTRVQIKN